MAIRAPVHFVVARHLLTHPEDSPSQLARHCQLRAPSAARAYLRLTKDGLPARALLLAELAEARERPRTSSFSFQLPNPDQWAARFKGARWMSGEGAAAIEGYDLVPAALLYYIPPDQLQGAIRAALDIFGKHAPPRRANLVLRSADPWMHLDPGDPLVELGQRLLDYAESRNIQIAKALRHA